MHIEDWGLPRRVQRSKPVDAGRILVWSDDEKQYVAEDDENDKVSATMVHTFWKRLYLPVLGEQMVMFR